MYARQVTELITGKDYLKNPYVEATKKDEEQSGQQPIEIAKDWLDRLPSSNPIQTSVT